MVTGWGGGVWEHEVTGLEAWVVGGSRHPLT